MSDGVEWPVVAEWLREGFMEMVTFEQAGEK